MIKVISITFAFLLLSLGCAFSQSFLISKKLFPISNNFVYQIHLLKDGLIADSIKISNPVHFTSWDTMQLNEINKNECIVFHQQIEDNTLTYDTLLILERYVVINSDKLVKQSGFELKMIDNLRHYDYFLLDNNFILYNKEGDLIKTYSLSAYSNLQELAIDISSQ